MIYPLKFQTLQAGTSELSDCYAATRTVRIKYLKIYFNEIKSIKFDYRMLCTILNIQKSVFILETKRNEEKYIITGTMNREKQNMVHIPQTLIIFNQFTIISNDKKITYSKKELPIFLYFLQHIFSKEDFSKNQNSFIFYIKALCFSNDFLFLAFQSIGGLALWDKIKMINEIDKTFEVK